MLGQYKDHVQVQGGGVVQMEKHQHKALDSQDVQVKNRCIFSNIRFQFQFNFFINNLNDHYLNNDYELNSSKTQTKWFRSLLKTKSTYI